MNDKILIIVWIVSFILSGVLYDVGVAHNCDKSGVYHSFNGNTYHCERVK